MNIVRHDPALNVYTEAPPKVFGVGDLFALLMRRASLILTVFCIGALATLVLVMAQPPRYVATATLMIDPTQERVVSEDQALSDAGRTAAEIDSEIEILKSKALAARVADRMELMRNPEWNAALRPRGAIASLKALLLGEPSPQGQASEAAARRAIVENVAAAIRVKRRALSYVVDVSVEGRNASETAAMANWVVTTYLQMAREAQVARADQATNWLSQRLEALRHDVEVKEAATAAYRTQTGLLSPDGVMLTERQLIEMQVSLMAARADQAERQARDDQVRSLVRSSGSADSMGDVLAAQTIRDLRQREADAAREQAELESTLGDLHPSVISGRAELADIRAQIQAETHRISSSLDHEAQVARSRTQSLERSLGGARGQLNADNVEMVRLAQLERDAAAARSVYEGFLQRYHEISGQGRIGTADSRMISPADAPNAPNFPKFSFALMLAAFVGLILGAASALIAELRDETLRDVDQIGRECGIAVIATIPRLSKRSMRLLASSDRHPAGYLVEEPLSQFAEAFRKLRAWTQYPKTAGAGRVIAVTSPMRAEGKTSSALCLARVAAMSNQRALVIDCDWRSRALNQVLDIDPSKGLQNVLSGETGWRNVVGRDEASNAHVLPLADNGVVGGDLLVSSAMRDLLDDLREHYDVIILDCASVLSAAETPAIAAMADATILLAKHGATSARAMRNTIEIMRSANADILGVTLNFADVKSISRAMASEQSIRANMWRQYQTA